MTESQGQRRQSGEGGNNLVGTSWLQSCAYWDSESIKRAKVESYSLYEWLHWVGLVFGPTGHRSGHHRRKRDNFTWHENQLKEIQKRKKTKTANPLNCITWFIWSVVSLEYNLWVYNSESNTHRAVTLSDRSSTCKLQVRSNRLRRSCCHWLQTCRVLQACSPCARDVSDLS